MDYVRKAASDILYNIEKTGAYSNMALKDELVKYDDFSPRDKRFITALVYGTLDKRITLDYIISRYSKSKKTAPRVLIILRMGLYQMFFMDKVPDTAAVNESVNLAKKFAPRAAGFVNAVLRNAQRGGITYPEKGTAALSVRYSFPERLVKRWTDDFGYEFTEQMLAAFCEPPRLTLRPNTLKISAEELAAELGEYGAETDGAAVFCGGFDIAKSKLYADGFFSVQDKAAMRASEILNPQSGENVIDMCAAPGGKCAHTAELMGNRGKVAAFDIYEHKIDLINKNARRLGIDIIDAKLGDAAEFNPQLENSADKVLCDVPCTGWGVIGRKPEIKYKDISNLGGLYETQRKILKNASKYVKSGGVILYSTCTVNRAENEDAINDFLENNGGFRREYEKTFYPHLDNTDGFYICRLKKE
ncbi:MAG: 16S rRNA (cytosine(967)-C(5))-methyltransferase RsmB [Firmicutes bacterium]|nr:16S rRNA (cytosine(967)-C(5))-methyltransferase RsmB [Bacillota bacterium]